MESESEATIYQNLLPEQDSNDTPMDQDAEGIPSDKIEVVDSEIAFKLKPVVKPKGITPQHAIGKDAIPEDRQESTSSEDRINTSDELMTDVDCDRFIAECRQAADDTRRHGGEPSPQKRKEYPGDLAIHRSENNRTRIYHQPGNIIDNRLGENNLASPGHGIRQMATTVDEEYLVIGGHVDSVLQQRIVEMDYIDFSRLLPKDKISKVEDHRYELVVRGGSTFFAPVSDRDATTISNFSKWEQAFRIYSNILTRAYPGKASDLIQYNHIIYTASLSFAWDNVYHYDKEFRMHISKFPQRSWAIILQQAWSMCLKDKLPEDMKFGQNKNSNKKSKEPCRRFNRGNCHFGARCKFDHRCSVKKCGKFGHGAHVCRLREQEHSPENKGNSNPEHSK